MWMERSRCSRDTQGHHRDQNFTGPWNCCAPALLVGCPWSAPVIRLWPQRSAVTRGPVMTCLVVAPITASTWPPGLKQPSTYVKAFPPHDGRPPHCTARRACRGQPTEAIRCTRCQRWWNRLKSWDFFRNQMMNEKKKIWNDDLKTKKQIRKITCVLWCSAGGYDTVSSLANSPGCCWSLENHHCFTTWLWVK